MEQLAKEQYDDSLHIWYQANLMTDHPYGQIFNCQSDIQRNLVQVIKNDLEMNPGHTLYFWYFGPDQANMTLMVRKEKQEVIVQINLKDFDFALNAPSIDQWKRELAQSLN
ncbi:hypothetical protein [Vaginisenegalia massiliensis]|uniref:hypothetical protein n=1 Tax=Vaginisenegalia massiliensis TaxID=2058294 RepID=UPI000F544A42|nr:hypothetical protein [Vaginisenegalia massiliensis]